MLIPFLDLDPARAAALCPTSYVTKMQLEALQILTVARWRVEEMEKGGKAPGYAHHPYTKWVAGSAWAWRWLVSFALALAEVEYPKRFPEKLPSTSTVASRIRLLQEPPPPVPRLSTHETAPCPLPKAAASSTADGGHEQRVREFRRYMAQHKNKDSWHFLYETRGAKRPLYMPPRTEKQEEIVQVWRKRRRVLQK